jgi:signal recognition particle GTPase
LTLGRNIDDALLDKLEETLISDDIGVETTERLIDRPAGGVQRRGRSRKPMIFCRF